MHGGSTRRHPRRRAEHGHRRAGRRHAPGATTAPRWSKSSHRRAIRPARWPASRSGTATSRASSLDRAAEDRTAAPGRAAGRRRPLHLRRRRPSLATADGSPTPGLVRLHMPPYVDPGETRRPGPAAPSRTSCWRRSPALSSRQSSFDGGPIHLVYPFALYVQGIWAAACGVAALIERQRSGLGQTVDGGRHPRRHGVQRRPVQRRPDAAAAAHRRRAGRPQPVLHDLPGARTAQWLFLAALTPKFQANAFKVLGVGDIHADPRIGGVPSRLVLPENRGWVRAAAGRAPSSPAPATSGWSAGDRRLPGWSAVRPRRLAGPSAGRRQRAARRGGRSGARPGRDARPAASAWTGRPAQSARRPRASASTTATAGRWPPRATPACQAVRPRRRRAAARARWPASASWISARSWPARTPASLLAGLGADVVKVEAPAGDAFRETGFVYNRGHARPGHRPEPRRRRSRRSTALVETADAVIDNSRLGVPKRLEFDYATLARGQPEHRHPVRRRLWRAGAVRATSRPSIRCSRR